MSIAALPTIGTLWKKLKCPLTDESINKMWYVYTMEHFSTIKKNEILPFAMTWRELESITLSLNRSEKDKYHMIHSYVDFKKWNKNEQKGKNKTDKEANQRADP